MTESSYRWVLWLLALLGLALDQGSKYGVFYCLYQNSQVGEQPIIPGAFNLLAQYTHYPIAGDGFLDRLRAVSCDYWPVVNRGALFGLANERNIPPPVNTLSNLVFTWVSLAAAIAIAAWSLRRTLARDWLLCSALGLILGGTLGNLYDRVVFNGVRDFLHWFYGFNWPVFNIADSCLVVGAFLLLTQALFARPAPSETAPEQPAQEVAEAGEQAV